MSRTLRLCLFVVCLSTLISPSLVVAQTDPDDLTLSTSDRLRQQIESGSKEQQRSALSEIRNLRNAQASRLALPALRDKEPIVRATAAGSVIFLPKGEASAALIPLLDDKEEFVRREAAFALGSVQDRAATTPLIGLMQRDKVLEVRSAAAIGLGMLGDASAVDSLLGILKTRPREQDEFLRRSAARSIGQIAQINVTGDPTVLTPQNFLPEKFKDLGSSRSTSAFPQVFTAAVDVLTGVLRNTNESDDTRREAAYSLGAIGDRRSIPVLQTFLSGADPYLAEIAREALMKIEQRGN